MQVDWWTLALQTVNFLVLVWLLERFLFRPVRAVLKKRQETVAHTLSDAEAARAQAEGVRQSLEASRKDIEDERIAMLKKAHDEIEAERDKMLEEARIEADRVIASARELVRNERADALESLREETVHLAGDMAQSILATMRTSVSAHEWLDQLESAVRLLGKDELGELGKELQDENARLRVVTAVPLKAADQDEWRARLRDLLGVAAEVEFNSDPALLGGAELHFPHALIGLNWADQLKQAQEVLLKHGKPG